jgi:hypothetical protein
MVENQFCYFICTCCELTSREKPILHLLVAVNGCEISEKDKERERGNACVNGADYHQMVCFLCTVEIETIVRHSSLAALSDNRLREKKELQFAHSSHKEIPYGNNTE